MIGDQLRRWAEERPDHTALQIRRDGACERITYADLWNRSLASAASLAASGIRPNDRVVLFAESGPEWVIAYLGIHLAGATVVPMDAQYRAEELEPLLTFCEPHAALADAKRKGEIEKLLVAGLRFPLWTIGPEEASSLARAPRAPEFRPVPRNPDDGMTIIFTSGTTGDPKGVQLTCGNIHSNVAATLKAIRITAKDNLLNILPLHHAYASTAGLLCPLMAGATVTFCPSLKAPDLIATLQETGVTVMPGVPQLFSLFDRAIFQKVGSGGLVTRSLFWSLYGISAWIRKTTGLRAGGILLPNIRRRFGRKFRFFVSGGAKLDENVTRRFLDLGILMLEGYGLTETLPVISFTPISRPKPGSVGLPLEGIEVRVDVPDANGVGEICVRGASVTKGYYRNEAATREVIRDGWFHTGDLGRIDRDGMITLTGRAKEVIVLSSGKNIYPDEVETHYEKTSLVKELCILPIEGPDGRVSGLRAVVVPDLAELAARGAANARERIRTELAIRAGTLPSYMRIADLVLFDGDLPRTRLGKLRRARIAESVARQNKARVENRLEELSAEFRALMERPASQRFLKRFEQVANVKGPFSPNQDLAMDLGVDSLTQIQLGVVLEEEFRVRIPEQEMASVRTIGDVLRRIIEAEAGGACPAAATEIAWSARLRAPPQVPLEKLFNVQRGVFPRVFVALLKHALALLARLCFGAKIEGADKIPLSGAVLICPNHQSYIDPPLLYATLPERLTNRMLSIAFAEIFSYPPLSWIVRIGRIILTGDAATMAESLKLSFQGLRRGMAVCLFPEGGRTTTGELLKPKPGAGILSCETGAPIVPVLVEGAVNTLSPVQPKLRFCSVRLVVGDPIRPPEGPHTMRDYQALMDRWEKAILEMRRRLREGGKP